MDRERERQSRWRKKRTVTAFARLLKSQKKDFTEHGFDSN